MKAQNSWLVLFNKLKIKSKIILAILPITLLAMGVTAWVSYLNLSANAIAASGEQLAIIGEKTMAYLAVKLDGHVESLQTLALSPTIIHAAQNANQKQLDPTSPEIQTLDQAWSARDPQTNPLVEELSTNTTSQVLKEYKDLFPEDVELILTGVQGLNIAITSRTTDYIQSDEDWWRQTYHAGQGQLYIGQPSYDESTKTWAIIISLPVRSETDHQVVGVLRGTVNITALVNSVSEIKIKNTGYASLVGQDGAIYYTRDQNQTMKAAPDHILNWVRAGKSGWQKSINDFTGQPAVMSLTVLDVDRLKNLKWALLVSQEQAEINASFYLAFVGQLLTSLILSLLLGLVCVLIANNIGRALHSLEKMADGISKAAPGERFMDKHVQETLTERGDEVGSLSRTFVSMGEQLQDSFISLHQSEQRFRSLSENMLAGLFVVEEGKITYANPALQQILCVPAETLLGQSPFNFIHPDEQKKAAEMVEACLLDQIPFIHGESRCIRPDGQTIVVEVMGTRLDFDEKPGFIGTLLDITSRKNAEAEILSFNYALEQRVQERTEQLESANQELEAFVYSVSHDLNGPLRRILGFSQIIQEDYGQVIDETGQDYLNRIDMAALNMEQLIKDLLRLSRISRSDVIKTPFNLAEMARSIMNDLSAQQPERQFELILPEILMVTADANLIRIALENLLGNAWKYSHKKPQTRIEIDQIDLEDGKAFFIKDNGIGFDMDQSEKLFKPFQRLHSASEFSGTGIGLTLVKRIIERHAGKIWVEAQPEQGATFYFTL